MRDRTLLFALAVTCAILAGCTTGAALGPARPVKPFSAPSSPSPTRIPSATARLGRPGNPLRLSCAQESFTEPPVPQHPQPGDLVVGPLFIVNGRRMATANPAGYGDHGRYKIPFIVTMGSTVTVTIARPARGRVVIDNPYQGQGADGMTAATYHSCAHKAGFFAQSFAFTHGRMRGCVPLEVRIGRQPRVRRVTLSLFAGSCAS